MSANADAVGFKLACNVHMYISACFEKLPVLAKLNFYPKKAYGLIQKCRATVNFGIGKFNVLSNMCNKNGNSHLMSDEDKQTLSLTCVPLCILEYCVFL